MQSLDYDQPGNYPVLRARLADVAWLLDRKRGQLGGSAIAAYVDIIDAVEAGR